MSYMKYTGLVGPNAVLTAIRDFAVAQGWTILENLTQDMSIDGGGQNDGLKLTLQAPGNSDLIICLRSANGKGIFNTQNNLNNAYGIGMVCPTGYTSTPASGIWNDQPTVTRQVSVNASTGQQEIIGVGIPVNPSEACTVFVNLIIDPEPLFVVSVEIEPKTYVHLGAGLVQKIGNWGGGTIFSGSRNSQNMFTTKFDADTIDSENSLIFAMNKQANTFLLAQVDAAPNRKPAVNWLSAGSDDKTTFKYMYTGKLLGLPVKQLNFTQETFDPKIPSYHIFQSQKSDDVGRDCNTLNCITVDLPLAVYVQRDPDVLRNYSQVGYIPGFFFISARNVAPGQVYEVSWPQSGNLNQAFPHSRRGGKLGYDGFSVNQ
ncbi:MAG: hypothetical protein E6713_07685 [Sporomusaceae bacterium]|nr:hypothetical protein [Sporomusaceae bacterium]